MAKNIDKILQKSLNQILLDGRYVDRKELQDAVKQSRREQVSIEEVLLKKELIEEDKLAEIISEHANLPFLALGDYDVSIDFLSECNIPPDVLFQYQFIPLEKIGNTFTIVTANLPDPSMLEAIASRIRENLFIFIGTLSDIKSILKKGFPNVSMDVSVRHEQESTVWQSIFDEADANIRADLRKKAEERDIVGAEDVSRIEEDLDGAFSNFFGEDEEEEIVQTPARSKPQPAKKDDSIKAEVDEVFANLFDEVQGEEEDEDEEEDSPRYQLQQLEECLKRNPSDYSALNNYVDLALSVGDLQLATHQLAKFARNLDRAGDRDGAVNCYEYILQLDPYHKEAVQYLGDD